MTDTTDIGDIDKRNKFIEKAKNVHGDKFDYSLVVFRNYRTKVKIICKVHGEFICNPKDHCNNRTGCAQCGAELKHKNQFFTTESFVKKAKLLFPNYDYSKVDYKNYNEKVEIICDKGHKFERSPTKFFSRKGCPECNMGNNGRKSATNDHFVTKAIAKHGDKYDYSLVNYVNIETEVNIICKEHQLTYSQKPKSHYRCTGCIECAKNNNKKSKQKTEK